MRGEEQGRLRGEEQGNTRQGWLLLYASLRVCVCVCGGGGGGVAWHGVCVHACMHACVHVCVCNEVCWEGGNRRKGEAGKISE